MKRILRSNSGSSLLIALFAITILSGLAILMVSRGSAGMKDTRAFRDVQSSFEAAEAGVEHARKLLNDGASNTWDDELSAQAGADGLTGTADDVPFIATTTLTSTQSYTVNIADNTDSDPSPIVDADARIWVTSTGTAGGKTTTIRVMVENDSQDAHISQEHYGEHSLGWAKSEGRDVAGSTRGEL
jgi:Tfp pilus assembly protein PilX